MVKMPCSHRRWGVPIRGLGAGVQESFLECVNHSVGGTKPSAGVAEQMRKENVS